jgi:hypothetical protein
MWNAAVSVQRAGVVRQPLCTLTKERRETKVGLPNRNIREFAFCSATLMDASMPKEHVALYLETLQVSFSEQCKPEFLYSSKLMALDELGWREQTLNVRIFQGSGHLGNRRTPIWQNSTSLWNIMPPWNRVRTISMSIFQTSCEHVLVALTEIKSLAFSAFSSDRSDRLASPSEKNKK